MYVHILQALCNTVYTTLCVCIFYRLFIGLNDLHLNTVVNKDTCTKNAETKMYVYMSKMFQCFVRHICVLTTTIFSSRAVY